MLNTLFVDWLTEQMHGVGAASSLPRPPKSSPVHGDWLHSRTAGFALQSLSHPWMQKEPDFCDLEFPCYLELSFHHGLCLQRLQDRTSVASVSPTLCPVPQFPFQIGLPFFFKKKCILKTNKQTFAFPVNLLCATKMPGPKKKAALGGRDSSAGRGTAAKSDDLRSVPGLTWWKERTDPTRTSWNKHEQTNKCKFKKESNDRCIFIEQYKTNTSQNTCLWGNCLGKSGVLIAWGWVQKQPTNKREPERDTQL